ncbi:hypothetical protein BD769DRAFT_1017768 [Suillus cothurnatus]|nr:hypothetical protein BD769DRAFT_1017768 [Suillus cothurnatus]
MFMPLIVHCRGKYKGTQQRGVDFDSMDYLVLTGASSCESMICLQALQLSVNASRMKQLLPPQRSWGYMYFLIDFQRLAPKISHSLATLHRYLFLVTTRFKVIISTAEGSRSRDHCTRVTFRAAILTTSMFVDVSRIQRMAPRVKVDLFGRTFLKIARISSAAGVWKGLSEHNIDKRMVLTQKRMPNAMVQMMTLDIVVFWVHILALRDKPNRSSEFWRSTRSTCKTLFLCL